MPDPRTATLYRMVLPTHECPYGVRSKAMLEKAGYSIEEHILATGPDVDAFKEEHGVATTPQIFIEGKRVGGSEDLEAYLADNSADTAG